MIQKKGNISVLVMFILIASSLIGILSMNYINQIISSADNVLSYYKSYYTTNAGLELLITEAKYRGIGFENQILTGSAIFRDNFKCTNCDLRASLIGRSNSISKEYRKSTESQSGCQYPIQLSVGESIMIPLFADSFSGGFADGINGVDSGKLENLSVNLPKLVLDIPVKSENKQVNIGMIIMSGSDLRSNGLFSRESTLNSDLISNFLTEWSKNAETIQAIDASAQTLDKTYTSPEYPFKNYLIIANNTGDSQISFCINSPQAPLPMDNFLISSHGYYHNQTLGLELIYKQPIPNFLLNSFGN